MEKKIPQGLRFTHYFTKEGYHPYDDIEWITCNAEIINKKDPSKTFKQSGVIFPKFWSQNSINIVASKYFYGKLGAPDREFDLRQLIDRVADTIVEWGLKQGYFYSEQDAKIYSKELKYILVFQYVAFGSPVWFNIGNPYAEPQAAACFILSAQDSMPSIKANEVIETTIFENGSGCGSNRSKLRSSYEEISGGGTAMGPLKAMLIYDKIAGSTKSGGKSRRAAKMEILNDDHGNALEFIRQKKESEILARHLIAAGYSDEFDNDKGAYAFAPYQNSNQALHVRDIFMAAATGKSKSPSWALLERYPISRLHPEIHQRLFHDYKTSSLFVDNVQGTFILSGDNSYLILNKDSEENIQFIKVIKWLEASEMLHEVASSTWDCGDPGLQFHDAMNKWHTCKTDGKIEATNPCSEYVFLDDTSCNLASHRLTSYLDSRGNFDYLRFIGAVRLLTVAQDIFIDNAYYPTPEIAAQTKKYRTLGQGYADVGSLLLHKGIPYDSDFARMYIGTITAVMHFTAYNQSAVMAEHLGAFERYEANRDSVVEVLKMHEKALLDLSEKIAVYEVSPRDDMANALITEMDDMVSEISEYIDSEKPVRNAQTTVIAPTGTIAFFLGADTTGIEPMLGLVQYKKLVGGGDLVITAPSVTNALHLLNYSDKEILGINEYIKKENTVVGAPHLDKAHYSIFATSFAKPGDSNIIRARAHIDMMAAVQPFISGAISKTVNMNRFVTIDEIKDAYVYAWEQGLKCIAIYRDKSKGSQPLSIEEGGGVKDSKFIKVKSYPIPERKRLPERRNGDTHKFTIGGVSGLLTCNCYPDTGKLGEIIIKVYKSGQSMSAMMDQTAILISTMLQYGIPVEVAVSKLKNIKYEPQGFTSNKKIVTAQSISDYIAKYLELEFINNHKNKHTGSDPTIDVEDTPPQTNDFITNIRTLANNQEARTGEPCPVCGAELIQSGTCKTCSNCFITTGCG